MLAVAVRPPSTFHLLCSTKICKFTVDVSRPDITFNTTTTATWDCCGTDSNGAATCGNPTNESFHASSPSLLSTYAIAGITTFLSAVSSTLSTVPSSTPLSTVSSVYSSAAVLSSTSTILAVAPTVTTTVTNTGHPSRLQAGAIVGIVIGAIAAAIFLSSIVYYFWRRKSPQRLPGPDAIVPQQAEYHRQAEMQGSNIWEMQKANDSKQLTAYDSPHELSP